jgi:hypothetical protein
MAQVRIAHKDGREYEVSESDFRRAKVEGDKTYQDLGFRIVANADGSPYEAPAERSDSKAKGE